MAVSTDFLGANTGGVPSSVTSYLTSSSSSLVGSATSQIPSSVSNFLDSASSLINPSSNPTYSAPNIPQSERLFTTRSRSVNFPGNGDRGQHAYIKILTTNPKNSIKRTGSTSLDNGPNGGVINQAVNGKGDSGYNSFLLTGINCSLEEKMQIVETFGDAEVSYYFGRQPIMFNFSGILIDSIDNNWFIQWLEMFVYAIRGTELAKNYELVSLVLPNMRLTGTVTRMSWDQNSARDVDIPFQFTFMAKEIVPIPVTMPNTPLNKNSFVSLQGVQDFVSQAGINDIKAGYGAAELKGVIQNPTSTISNYASSLLGFGGISGGSASGGGLSSLLNPITNTVNGASSSILGIEHALYMGVTANLNGIRASLFSPIYGVLSSLSKLVSVVAGVSSFVNALENSVKNIVRDVTNIKKQALGVLNAIEHGGIVGSYAGPSGLYANVLPNTIAELSLTKGVICTQPATLSFSVLAMASSGQLPMSNNFISSKIGILNSIPVYSSEKAAIL